MLHSVLGLMGIAIAIASIVAKTYWHDHSSRS